MGSYSPTLAFWPQAASESRRVTGVQSSIKRDAARVRAVEPTTEPPVASIELVSGAIGEEVSTLATRGGFYLGLRYGLGILISCGNMLLLTRWIGPHAYGLFVTSVGLTAFLASVARAG